MLIGLVGCEKSSDVQDSDGSYASGDVLQSSVDPIPAVYFEPVTGELIDTGVIQAICPDGWYNIEVYDYFSEPAGIDTSMLRFQKFSDDRWSNLPFVSISFFGTSSYNMSYEDQLGYYDNAKLLQPFMIEDTVWEGLTYPLGDSVVEVLISPQNVDEFSVLIQLEGYGEVITLEDDDVLTILTSIRY